MVHTASTIAFTSLVQPITLGSAFIGGGVSSTASGWGQTSHPGSAATNLQFLTKPTLTNADCRNRHSTANAARVFDNTICTFLRAGAGMCMGDSGGPLIAGGTVIGAVSCHFFDFYNFLKFLEIFVFREFPPDFLKPQFSFFFLHFYRFRSHGVLHAHKASQTVSFFDISYYLSLLIFSLFSLQFSVSEL